VLEYVEKSKPVWDSSRREVHIEYADEASPIIIAQNTVRAEMLTFRTSESLFAESANYTGVISARLTASKFTISAPFTFNVSDSDVAVWRESSGRRFSMISVERADHRRPNSR
jgi:hypothetical protein